MLVSQSALQKPQSKANKRSLSVCAPNAGRKPESHSHHYAFARLACRVEPSEGVLEPDQRQQVKFIFTPTLNRTTPYLQTFPLKITGNPKGKEVTCKATGQQPRVEFR